jgi:hypothetical protein
MTGFIRFIITYIGKDIESRKFSASPIYIGGCGRSGTTLLLSVLSAHKDIFACPKELNPFQNANISDKHIITPKYFRIYRTFIAKKIKKSATRFCEKSPANIRYIELIDSYHKGDFKMIQILRDGRDVILSKHPKGGNRYWVDPQRWIDDVNTGLKYLQHPKIHTITYEKLVTDYENTITGICTFLEIPVSEEILNWYENATVRQNNALFSSIKEISSSSIGKWKQEKNSERVKKLTDIPEAVELMKILKYI